MENLVLVVHTETTTNHTEKCLHSAKQMLHKTFIIMT